MEALFLKLFNMSVTASWLVLAVVVLRFLLKKAPKSMICFLWLLVAVRLIFPISIESVVSLIPSTETITEESLYSDTPVIDSGINAVNDRVNPVISESLAPEAGDSVNPMQVIICVASYIWVIGMGCMLLYAFISYIKLRVKVREAVIDGDKIWLCDRINTPFILGVIRPRIYIPSYVEEKDKEYVIAHERAHLKRKDHWWKPLGFVLLTVYWFNPVMWVAYILLCKDIEYACDEKVLNERGTECKKEYSNALINCSVSRINVAVCPLAFGEVGVKDRIKSVLGYKQPAFWMIIGALIICIAFIVVFMTNPKSIRHCGSDMTADELNENYEDCLKEYSVNEFPELVIGVEAEQIREVSFTINASGKNLKSDYLNHLENILASAIMAYGGTQYEKLPYYVDLDYINNNFLYGDVERAFVRGTCEMYYESILINVEITSEGYEISDEGLLPVLEGEEHYINMTCTMENYKAVCGEYYMEDDLFGGNGPIVIINEDQSYSIVRGNGEKGNIVGTYEYYDNQILLENNEDYECYAFEVVDANTIKFLPERGNSIRVYYGNGVTELNESIFVRGEKHNSESKPLYDETVLYMGEDSQGKRATDIVRDYYEYLEEEYSDKRSQWFTDEYLEMTKNAVYQDMTLLDLEYCTFVSESDIRESDLPWIDEIKGKYSAYCLVQTKARVEYLEDGPSGMKGDIINQQYFFALVLDPKDGRWKIDEFVYPGFEVVDDGEEIDYFDIIRENFMFTYSTN